MKKLRILLLSVISLSLIIGCENKEPNSTKKEKVTIAMVTFPGYAPLYVAKEKGFFGDVDVKLKRIEDIGQMRSAMVSGNIDIYAATYDIFQSNQGADIPGVGFMLIDESHGADGIIVSKEIKTIKDLKGKTLAAEPGFPPFFLLQYILDKENLTLNDITLKDIATQDAGAAFTSKSVDAAGLYEPLLSSTLKVNKGSKLLISSATEPGLLADLLFASESMINNNPETLKKIAQGWFRALEFIDTNPDEAYVIMGKEFGVNAEEMKEFKETITWYSKEDNKMMFDTTNDVNVYKIFNLEGDILEKNGAAKRRYKAQDKITNVIINDIK